MLKLENAFLIDICFGYPFGKLWLPTGLPVARPEDMPKTYLLNAEHLSALKTLVELNDIFVTGALEGLKSKADIYLTMPDPSVTHKSSLTNDVSRQDYISLAKYWWPDPKKPDGLPYIRQDGEVNPACYSNKYDLNRLELFSDATLLLAVTAYLTGAIDYANKVKSMVNTWFVNLETKQTAHFKYAQIVIGKESNNYFGLIEARRLIYVCEAVQLVKHLKVFSEKEVKEINKWFADLLEWYDTSEQGRKAQQADNNIGFWYDLQRIVFARFIGQDNLADKIVRDFVLPRIDQQIDAEGRLLQELERAMPYDYVAFTLLAMAELDFAARDGQINLAEYSGKEGQSFKNAINWLTQSFHGNDLLEPGLALTQLAAKQRQINSLENEIQSLEQKIKNLQKQQPDSKKSKRNESESAGTSNSVYADPAYQALQARTETAEKEAARLRVDLNDNYCSVLSSAISYRGIHFVLKEQAELIKRKDEEVVNAGIKFEHLKDELEKEFRKSSELKRQLGESVHREEEFQGNLKDAIDRAEKLEEKLFELKINYEDASKGKDRYLKRYNAVQERNLQLIKDKQELRDKREDIKTNEQKSDPKVSKAIEEKTQTQIEMALVEESISMQQSKYSDYESVNLLLSGMTEDIEPLKVEYMEKGLDKEPDTFALYRIIGNDLYPRHIKGQSRENLKFILENEPEFENCEKIFVVNRIIDKKEEKAIIKLIEKYNKEYIHIPFEEEKYKKIGFDTDCLPESGFLISKDYGDLGPEQKARLLCASYRLKNNYVMNNNGARNTALLDGKKRAKWTLPFDGNCFVTEKAWDDIKNAIITCPYLKYFAAPMTRVTENDSLLSNSFVPDPVEEPQLIFRKDTGELFNEEYCYGRRPKVEMFWRLGMPGKWANWRDDPWDLKRPQISDDYKKFGVAGWVARLNSGMEHLEQDNKESFKARGLARTKSIISTIQNIDLRLSDVTPEKLMSFDANALESEKQLYISKSNTRLSILVDKLVSSAEEALKRGPYSVIDKTTLPPSGKPNDYWHPAPYWWPNPDTPDGFPYIRKDGERVPGTIIYEPDSDKYDRTRLQRVFDDSTILALAWIFTGEHEYAQHGARIMHRFFIDSANRMNPHLKYAQVRMGRNKNVGFSTGIIEMKDLYYYLDAVRILYSSGVIPEKDLKDFKDWLSEYLNWLLDSTQGKKERMATNNHGVYYDLQVASVASFLDRNDIVYETLVRAQARIQRQFAPDGSQPDELIRTTSAHYCCFTLQGWLNLAELASRWSVDFWAYKSPEGSSLINGAKWLLSHMGKEWPYQQIDEFDYERFLPVWFKCSNLGFEKPAEAVVPDSIYEAKPIYYPHDGIKPYWNIGLSRFYHRNNNKNIILERHMFDLPQNSDIKLELDRINEYLDSAKPNNNKRIVFAISFRSKAVSLDWNRVQFNLENTINAIIKNTQDNYLIIVAGHEKPDIECLNHEKVHWITVEFQPPDLHSNRFAIDKLEKRRTIGSFLRSIGFSGFFMPLDDDDWIHHRFVEFINSMPLKDCYIFERGIMTNIGLKEIWLRNTGFYRGCGSSAVYYFSNHEFPVSPVKEKIKGTKFDLVTMGHENSPQNVRIFNLEYEMIDYPLITWVLGHGDNLSVLRGKKDNAISAKKYSAKPETLERWVFNYFKVSNSFNL